MKRTLAALCAFLACQSPALAQQFKIGDRVYITTVHKYGTVVPGGIQGATGVHPSIRLDDAPAGTLGGTIYDASSVVPAASVASPSIPGSAQTGGTAGGQSAGYPNARLSTDKDAMTPQPEVDPPVTGGDLPGGNYDCSKTSSGAGLRGFGSIEIKGRSYRGMDATIGPFIPFTVRDGYINFTGGLKGLEEMKITKSYISRNSNGQPIIVIRYSTTSRGFTSTAGFECSCQ
ncbi:MAG: hypothetical protein K2W95_09885 [Candidatus Obscuribacterales bacterium]|nr:hypothetical protein [Candidatus Obscuribacterales bacterium]